MIDKQLVYIGKSTNMLNRIAQHLSEIECAGIGYDCERKYYILAEAEERFGFLDWTVLYSVPKGRYNCEDLIGRKEGELIRRYLPPLNYQIPDAEDWKHYKTNPSARTITLDEILARKENANAL